MHKPARKAATIAAGVALVAGGTACVAAAAPDSAASSPGTARYYAFDVNNGAADPGFVPVAGTNPAKFAQGDELILNDQVTSTRWAGHGYPIVGFDSGICTLTRIPEKNAEQTIANCVVTVAFDNGSSLAVQGAVRFKSQQPEAASLAVTGGTGRFSGTTGELRVSFTKNYKILSFTLK